MQNRIAQLEKENARLKQQRATLITKLETTVEALENQEGLERIDPILRAHGAIAVATRQFLGRVEHSLAQSR